MNSANEALARRYFEEFCTGRRLDIAAEIMTADHVYHDPNAPTRPGPDGMAETVAVYQNGVEGHWDVQEIISDGDRVAVRWVGRGRHTGDVMGIPPTGRAVEVQALSVLHIRDGKIAENHTVWDTLGFLRQLGVIPEAAPAGASA